MYLIISKSPGSDHSGWLAKCGPSAMPGIGARRAMSAMSSSLPIGRYQRGSFVEPIGTTRSGGGDGGSTGAGWHAQGRIHVDLGRAAHRLAGERSALPRLGDL